MGTTRPASGIKAKAHTLNKGSQTALITRLSVSLCLNARRESRLLKKTKRDEAAEKCPDARRVAPIRAQCSDTTALYIASILLLNL